MEYKTFAERLAKLLNEQGVSQKQLAEKIGVTQASMSRYMNTDRIPKSEILANIATVLHTTSDYLLGTEEEGNIDSDYPKIVRLIARNTSNMTKEQKRSIINTLLEDD
ncbi:MAG: helix-turn-helix domain-containing protein [Ruminococcus sp.]|nr:helix-turn-helix domain-containing protein [Ruminococcus sp.]